MKIKITEFKSMVTLSPFGGKVRVFVDNDYHYGYFVDEPTLYAMLTEDQQKEYLQTSSVTLDVPPQIAQQIIDIGLTPYKKQTVCS